jgi:hypothetical protein
MPSPFTSIGGASTEQSKYGTLLINEFFSGQYSNSNPLREAATPLLYQRFYSGARYETIRSGSNIEVSPRLTLIRRYGNSLYNTQSFTNTTGFYSFRTFVPSTQTAAIRVIVDTGTAVYDGTANGKLLLFSKKPGALQTSFQSIGNTLYAADGISSWKWVWAPSRVPSSAYPNGDIILDGNNNIQQSQGLGLSVTSTSVASDVLTVNYTGSAQINVNDNWEFFGMSANPALNGVIVNVLTVGGGAFTASYQAGNYSTLAEGAGAIIANVAGTGNAGAGSAVFSSTIGQGTIDGAVGWICRGPSVQNIGIVAPTTAPTVGNVFYSQGAAWVASTYYWPEVNGTPNPIVVDSNSNIQLLTTAGETGSSIPSWNTSGTTTDGTAVWTFQGQAARQLDTPYAVNAYIAVTVVTTYTVKTPIYGPAPHFAILGYIYKTYTYTNAYFFQCSTSGVTSAVATNSLSWPGALGGTISDGTVTWTNIGYQVTHTSSSNSSPTSANPGNVSTSTLVSTTSAIVDNISSGGGEGFLQNCTVAGKSGATVPTWAVNSSNVEAAGLITHESTGLQWTNGGPAGAANTGTWVYGYSFGNSVTGHESSLSPLSIPILLAAESAIALSGAGDPNYLNDGYDVVNIYRSTQGQTTPFLLTTIQAPPNGAPWSFTDTTPDPPNPGATLDTLIEGDTIGNNAPPPTGLWQLTYYLGDLFGSTGVFQYWSGTSTQPVGVGAESWPGGNNFQMPEVVTKSWASATGLLIFTKNGIWFSQGTTGFPAFAPLPPTEILTDIGLLSPTLFTVNGSIPVIVTSDLQMIALDPSAGVTRYSDPIADTENGMGGFSNVSSYLTWYTNNIDSAYYLCDGVTGWFRLCPTAAPESGFTWSTKANIGGGCSAIAAIETAPGVKQLLIGANGTGPILARDLTTNADNGVAYEASCIIGSLVFAQPNQCAEIRSISTYALATGTRVQVSLLGNEVEATADVPFELLQDYSPEPARLQSPVSLYADRWYLIQQEQPLWMQHMQLQFAWPAVNEANELLAYAVFGAVRLNQ